MRARGSKFGRSRSPRCSVPPGRAQREPQGYAGLTRLALIRVILNSNLKLKYKKLETIVDVLSTKRQVMRVEKFYVAKPHILYIISPNQVLTHAARAVRAGKAAKCLCVGVCGCMCGGRARRARRALVSALTSSEPFALSGPLPQSGSPAREARGAAAAAPT